MILFFGFLSNLTLLYSFLIAAVGNHYNLTGLKQLKSVISQCEDRKSEMGLAGLKSSCREGCVPLCLFSFQKLLSFLGSQTTPSKSMVANQVILIFHKAIRLSCFPLSFIRTHVIILGPARQCRIISPSQSFDLITFASLFCHPKQYIQSFHRLECGNFRKAAILLLRGHYLSSPLVMLSPPPPLTRSSLRGGRTASLLFYSSQQLPNSDTQPSFQTLDLNNT